MEIFSPGVFPLSRISKIMGVTVLTKSPHEGFSGGDFVRTVTPIIFDILERGKTPGENITIHIYFEFSAI